MERKGGAASGADTIKDAEKNFKKGQEALKTGLFKWSADHLAAALYFEKAAKQFKALGARD